LFADKDLACLGFEKASGLSAELHLTTSCKLLQWAQTEVCAA
jgi:hypothetical protein